MSLRPRYSLLALLILTALCAGGIKLWRGPHRAGKDSPWPPGVDTKRNFPSAESIALTWGPLQFECEYYREWQTINVVALLGWTDQHGSAVFLQPGQAAATGKAYLYRVQAGAQPLNSPDEKVLCWFFENERYVSEKPAFWQGQWRAYLLSDRRKIYSYEPWTAQALVSEVALQEIEDFKLRACIETERDKLP